MSGDTRLHPSPHPLLHPASKRNSGNWSFRENQTKPNQTVLPPRPSCLTQWRRGGEAGQGFGLMRNSAAGAALCASSPDLGSTLIPDPAEPTPPGFALAVASAAEDRAPSPQPCLPARLCPKETWTPSGSWREGEWHGHSWSPPEGVTLPPPSLSPPFNCLGSAPVVQEPRVAKRMPGVSSLPGPERGAEGKRTGVQASQLGQRMRILSVVLKATVAESFWRELSLMLTSNRYGKSLVPRRKEEEPLWRGPEGEGRKLCVGRGLGSKSRREKKRQSQPQNCEALLLVHPSHPRHMQLPLLPPTPPNGRLTAEANSPLLGPGPDPEAAADLNGLSVVDFYHVEVKTVDPFARGDESAAF